MLIYIVNRAVPWETVSQVHIECSVHVFSEALPLMLSNVYVKQYQNHTPIFWFNQSVTSQGKAHLH